MQCLAIPISSVELVRPVLAADEDVFVFVTLAIIKHPNTYLLYKIKFGLIEHFLALHHKRMSLFRKLFQHQKCNIIGEIIFLAERYHCPVIVRNAPCPRSARDPRLQPWDVGDPGQGDGGGPGVQRGRGGRGHH